jgi:hypothetical protein
MSSGFGETFRYDIPGMTEGTIRIGGLTRPPDPTWAVAHDGMPLGQMWIVRADDDVPALEGVTGIPPTEFVAILNPADPDWLAIRGDDDGPVRIPDGDV